MVMEVVHEDMDEGNMQCTNHPYKNSTPGGICAFCLQEKLGKLVSSSFPVSVFPSSSSSPTPSFRSDSTSTSTAGGGPACASASTLQSRGNDCNYNGYHTRRARLPFVLTQKKKKKKDIGGVAVGSSSDSTSIVFKRSKSTTTPRRGMHFLDENCNDDDSPHRRRFWSFLYLSKNSTVKRTHKTCKDMNFTPATPSTVCSSAVGSSSVSSNGVETMRSSLRERKREDFMLVIDENGSPNQALFDRKVSRSRSVGCGSRSFSGDFFERISTGFGDCTLRRVESNREGGKSKVQPSLHKNGGHNNGQDCIKERVSCGGIFSGFMVNSSLGDDGNLNGKSISAHLSSHGRSKSWGWAFASPMRAFGKPSNKRAHRGSSSSSTSNKNVTPNLAAIPSLLAVSG